MKTAIEKELDALAQKAFASHNFNFQPLFPNVLVRLFQAEQQVKDSLIIRPQNVQNPNYYGMVVRTWEPFTATVKGDTFEVKSELQPGDIVISTYYAGVETGTESLNDAGYRVMSEGLDRDKNTGRVIAYAAGKDRLSIFVKIELFDMHKEVIKLIDTVATGTEYIEYSPTDKTVTDKPGTVRPWFNKTIIDKILADYDIVPKMYKRT